MAGASIVVDIKAQITGYKEQIENIKNELKKVDPGSQIGKSLNRTLEQADQKLSKLSRNAEQRITSQGQLDRLFDQLHDVSDLMRSLGQGMQSVGLNDVLLTASDQARQLGQDLKTVQDEMKTKGSNFFEELTKTNPKELQSVFDQLKFDPKTMGVDEFVTKFKEATQSAKDEVKDLAEQQKQAQADLDKTKAMKALHDQLPVALQGKNVRQDAIRNVFGLNNKGMDQAQLVSNRDVMAQEFIDKIRTSLEADTNRSEENKANLSGTLQETLTKLQEAKTKEQVQSILQDLDKALKSTAGEGHGGSYRGIAGMSGESFNSELVSKLTENTYKADQGFVDQLTQLKDLMMGSSNESAQAAGNQLSTILNSLLNPTDLTTFQNNMQALVSIIQDGLKSVNSSTKDFDVTERTSLANSATEALKMAQERVGALDTIGNSKAYTNLMDEYNQLKERMSQIEEKLGIENGKNQSAVAGGINAKGGQLLNTLPIIDKSATDSLKQYTTALEDAQHRQQMMGKVEGIAQRWFSVYAAVRMVSKAFRSMKENVTKIDDTITEIAIVTDMSQSDLWRQMPRYTDMARKYGSSIEGVYQVSQLYYQQGLEQEDVMALTEQTLKMARISGLDYADATNYMTNAIRSFKMEMQDAQTVVDVYSALAASSASSTTELATAMSKTASSAAAVGASFESTSAMMAVMIETTRESPENIGSALKSIISRYGELKENKTGIDEEGEEYSLNKVDTALQSVGISIHDAQGQFRDFDDVIMELAQSWDTIDTNTQRYIATVMAGNRQQSRFLALVSNGERLAELTETAENSEDASTLQVLKTMDSIAYKSQNLQTSLQSLYTDSGIENLYKGILDGANEVVKTFTDMPTLFQLPIPALASFATNFISIANVVLTAIQVLKRKFMAQWETDDMTSIIKKRIQQEEQIKGERLTQQEITKIRQEESAKRQNIDQKENGTAKGGKLTKTSKAVLGMQLAGTALSLGAGLISDKGTGNRAAKAGLGITGSALQYGAMGMMLSPAHPLLGAGIGAALGGLMGIWQNLSYIWESTADQAKRLKEEADTAKTDYQQKKAVSSNAEKEVANIKKLADAQFDSVEAREKYIEAANKLATDMPELVNYYDAEGNAILDLSNAYTTLAEKRREANDASKESAETSLSAANKAIEEKQETVDKVVTEGITKSINFGNLKGTAKDKWQALKATDNIMGYAAAAEKGGGKGDDLSGIIQIANEKLLGNTPGLQQLYSLLVADNGAGIRSLIETPDKRDAMFKQWNQELESITDPASKAAIDFVLYQLQGISTELTSAFGELNQATAKRTQTIHANAAEYVNNFIADTRTMAEYGPQGEAKTQAKEIIEMFKGIDNSSEIVTNYLTQQFLSGGYKTWDDFIKELEDPEKSPLLNFINILNQIPTTLHTELNNLLQNKSQYTKEVMQQKIATLLGNDELAEAIINTYSNYYDNLMDAEEFKKQVHKNEPDLGYFRTMTDDRFDVLSTLSGEEMATIVDMQDNIVSMYESGRITKSQAHGFMKAYSDLWGTGDEAIQAIMARITDFSAESLEELYTLIDNSDEFTSDEQKETFKQSLAALFGFIPQNLNTSLKSYEEQMVTTTKDYSKDMSSATKGMDYEAASELAKKLNIDTSTEYFDVREGELFLKNTSLIYDHYFGKEGISTLLTSKMHEYSEKLQQHVEDLNKLDLQNLDVTTLTKEQAEEDFSVDLVTLKQLITDFKASGLTTMTDEWISNYFEGTITNTEDLVNTLFKSDDLTRAIDSGKLEDIVKAGFISDAPKFMIESYMGTLKDALQSGDFSRITGEAFFSKEFKSKLPELKQTYDDAQSSVIDDMISGLDESFTYIEGTEFNKELLSDLKSKGLAELTPAVNGVSNAIIKASRDQVLTYLEGITNASQVGMTTSELREKIASLRADTYEKSNMGTLQTILDNYDNIDEVAYQNLLDHWDFANISAIFTRRADGTYKANLPKLVEAYRNGSIQLDDLTQEKMNEVVTKAIDDGMSSIISAADYTTKGTTKFQDMADFTKVFNEAIPGINAEITDLFSYDKDLQGYTLDTTSYRTYLEAQKQLLISLGESTEYIDGIIENANKSIIDAIDVKSFMEAEQKGTKEAPSKAREALIKQLKNANIWESGVVEKSEDWRDYYAAAADAVSLGADKFTAEEAAKALANESKKWNDNIRTEAANNFIEQIEKGGSSAVMALHALATVQGKELTSEEIESAYLSQVQQLEEAFDQLEYGIGSIVNGEAVTALQNAGYKLTELGGGNAVIDSIGNISEAYQNYYEALERTNSATVAALNEAKAKVLETQDGRYREQKAIDALGDAAGMTYTTFASILSDAGIKLTDDIIEEYTESLGGNKMRIKDFASFARVMGWDYDSEEYTSAFKSYNDSLIERNKQVKKSINDELKGLEDIQPGDWLNLTEFSAAYKKSLKRFTMPTDMASYLDFAQKNWKKYSDKYESPEAYAQAYADAAKSGNEKMIKSAFDDLQASLLQYGATLSDGILRLADDANLIGIAKTLQNAVTFAQIEISDDIKDMVQNIIDSYTDLIVNGIDGSLTNVQKSELQKKLKNIGIETLDTDFIQGTDGLQLSINKAIEAYTRLGQADVRSQKKIYKALNQQLKDNRTSYQTATSMLSNLTSMQEELTELKKRNNQADTEHIKQLENEIELLKEMQMYSLVNEDQSWNFMSNDAIPDSIDNALNYFANWKTLESSLDTWAGSGTTDLNSFAAALKHVQEVADATGQDFSFMGSKITAGGDAYGNFLDKLSDIRVWDSKNGKWVLDNTALKNILDFNMSLGKKGLSQGLKDNVDAYVERNAEVLKSFDEFTGGLAEVYKTLHDYGQEDNGHAFEDFLDINGDFNYKKFMNQLGQHEGAQDEFKKFTDKVKINNQEWDKAMGSTGTLKADTEEYRAMMAVMKMAMSENWDLESDYMAVAEQLSAAGANMDVQLGDTIIHAKPGATIIETKDGKDTKFIDPYGDSHDSIQEAQDAINRHALEDYQKALGQYQPTSSESSSTITIDGQTITVEIKDGKIVFKTSKEDENPVEAETFDEGLAKLQEKVKQETKSEIASTATSEGWAAAVSAQYQNAQTYEQMGGHISAEARQKGQTAGLTSARAISDAYNAAVKAVGTQNGKQINEENINDFNEAIAAEFYASTGIKLDPEKIPVKMEDGMAQHIADEMNMTQTAVDVMNGITQAFTSTGEGSVTQALSSAIASAFANEKGLEIPALEIKPESVSLAAETTPSIGDITVSADKITIDGTVEPIAADQIPDGKGKVVYDDSEITIKDILGPDGHGKIIYDDYSIDISNITGPDGHGKIIYDKAEVTVSAPTEDGEATGNVGLAAGNAKARGTLMGELGPELVVSGGRYFVVGQSGPEMVDLADDAIVFNHLQTKSLLEKGTSSTRGRAITNEQNAVAYATGSINGGPAAANVTDVNKKYRGSSSIWDAGFNAIKNATKNTDDKALKSFLKELERWYNWLQQIAHIEKEITYQEALRSKYQNSFNRTGADYYNSQKQTLDLLNDQLAVQQDLVKEQKAYLEQRKQELENSPFSTVYRFDERGQIQYQEGAFENFSKLFGTNDQGIPYYTAEQQYDALIAMGMEDYMKYDNSGQEIDKSKDGWQATAVQAFYDKMEKQREEFQSLHDDIMDGEEKIIELQDNQNQILHDIEDNQIAVEQKVLKAVEESRQRAIDDAKDERDAIEKSANTLIDGLNKQLEKERTMYQNQQSADELASLQRRLGILQRSGGSASEIADLQSQIEEKQYDKYFETQEQQIQAIQDASDAELERLDNQISLMEETLAYEKEFGLLWNEVDEVLKQSPEDIATYIKENTSEYWGVSLAELNQKIREDLFEIDQFKQFQNVDGGMQALINAYGGNTENTEESSEGQQNEDQPIEGGGGSKYAENVAGTWKQGSDGRWWYEHNEADENGKKYTTSNWEKINDKWYYFDEEGWMKTGWLQDGDKWYYLDDTSGEMLTNTTKALTWNGKTQNHTFNENGVWTGAKDIQTYKKKESVEGQGGTTEGHYFTLTFDDGKTYTEDGFNSKKEAQEAAEKKQKEYEGSGIKSKVDTYEYGGIVDKDKFAFIHADEGILTPKQTKVLRDNILSNRPDSLINLLKSYNEAYRGLSQNAYDSISNTTANMVNIERAEVNLQIEKLADDYDSRRAANTIMDEMLRIASKTKANNSVRR